ncbi:MAG TPA: hypothetical protein VM389_07150, partial [Phycisphaerae bacterium]|nr:hypothetical protein [Phycisphaerae bacterium]
MTGTVRRFYLSGPRKRRGGWVVVVLGAGMLMAAPLLFLHQGGNSLVLLPWALFVPVALAAHWGFFMLRCVEISRAELSIVYALYRRKIPRERIVEWKRIKRDPVDAAYGSGPSRRSAGREWI